MSHEYRQWRDEVERIANYTATGFTLVDFVEKIGGRLYFSASGEPDPIAPSFDFQPEIVRQSPAVRMASRSLPNPNGEAKL